MARNTAGLKRGGSPGRPKGLPNKATQDIKAFCQKVLGSSEYRDAAIRRVIRGKAPHLETLMMHYAYGKPKETVDVNLPMRPLVIDLLQPGEGRKGDDGD